MLGLLHSLVLPGVLPLWLLCVRIGSMELLCDVRAQWVTVLLWVECLPDEQPQELGNRLAKGPSPAILPHSSLQV